MTHNIRISALLISLIFLLPGCLSYPPSQDSSSDEGTVFQMNPISYDIIIGDQYLEIDNQQKLDFFTKLLEKNHNNILKNSTIPKMGGNWSHYFVCGDGTPIEYSSLEREYYFCPSTSEQLSGEQYLSSWRTLRHRELIQEFGLTSSLSYVLTGNSSEGLLAKNLLLNYSIIYPNLPISDKLNRTGDIGGKLTSQSLDEAVFLIDFAWMYHMIHPILNSTERNLIEQNLLMEAINVLRTEGNQNRGNLSNWFTYHNAAIAMVAASTDNKSLLNESLYFDNGLINQIMFGFDSDGFWHEGSIAYQNYTLTAIALHLEAAEYMGIDLFDFEWNINGKIMEIKDPFVAPLQLIRPDLTFPRLNDAIDLMKLTDIMDLLEFTNYHWDDNIVSYLLGEARSQLPNQTFRSILWNSEINQDPVEFSSIDFSTFGLSIIRMNGHFVLIDYGSHGGWHGHRDKLNIELVTPYGAIFEDPGNVRYSLPASHEWYRSSFAHNTISINDSEQPEMKGYLIGANHSSEGSVVVAGFEDPDTGITVERSLVVVSFNNGIVIFDFFRVKSIADASLSRTYHFQNDSSLSIDSIENIPNILPEPARQYATLERSNLSNSDSFWVNNSNSDFSANTVFQISEETDCYNGLSNNIGKFVLLRDERSENFAMFRAVHVIQVPQTNDFNVYWSDNNITHFNSDSLFVEVEWNDIIPSITKESSKPSL